MNSRTSSIRVLLMAVALIGLMAAPMAVSARAAVAGPPLGGALVTDLAPALSRDGTFHGVQGLTGSVDTKSWSLVSDVAAGEPPRFAPTTNAAIAPGAWSALGSNPANSFAGALNFYVYAILVSGTDLYVGGNFYAAAGIPAADFLAKWNGSTWSALAPNQNGPSPINAPVRALAMWGSNLLVGGEFYNAGGEQTADYVAVWNGSTWTRLGTAINQTTGAVTGQVHALAVNGNNVYIGGYFYDAANIPAADFVVHWDGSSWHSMGATTSNNGPIQGFVYALAATATDVYAGGAFQNVYADATIDYVAEYNVANFLWTPLDANGANGSLNATVRALRLVGTDLYVGGEFTTVDGQSGVNYLARWTGFGWSQVANPSPNAFVRAIVVSGSNIYVGGDFTDVGGNVTADSVARWNSNAFSWSALGSNGSGGGALGAKVNALGLSPNALFVGGNYQNAATIAEADFIAAFGIGGGGGQKPDGRIKKGSGTLVGNNIYNTTGLNQTRQGSAAIGSTITFTVSIQNDGTTSGKFKVAATGTASANYQVKYFRGTTDITGAVVAGTYQTATVGVGNAFAIKAKVKVLAGATVGSSTTRLVTITSVADGSKVDAVKFIGKRS